MNCIQLVGRLVNDVSFTTDRDGTPRCNFTIAVERLTKRNRGRNMTADFFDCTAFNRTAEATGNYQRDYNGYRKGDTISVIGRCEIDVYTDKNGQPVRRCQVIANELSCIVRKNPAPQQQASGQGYAPAPGGYQPPEYQACVYNGPGTYAGTQPAYPNPQGGQPMPGMGTAPVYGNGYYAGNGYSG